VVSRRKLQSTGRRLRATVQRVEQQPYDFTSPRREPRASASTTYFCCQLSGSLAAATGSWPTLTAGKLISQQIYMATFDSGSGNYKLTALPSASSTVINYSSTAFATGKTTEVRPSGLGDVFVAVVQDC
jgi:hypothetical protein